MQLIQVASLNFSIKKPTPLTSVSARLLHDACNQLGENGGTPKKRKTEVYHRSMMTASTEPGIQRKSQRPVTSTTGNVPPLEAPRNSSTPI